MLPQLQPCVSLEEKRCVYCQQAFITGERSLAVVGASRYLGYTDAFEIPAVGLMSQRYTVVHLNEQDGARRSALCLRPACSSCTASSDSYLAHQECLDIRANLLPGKATCKEIWEIGAATKPWLISPAKETIFKSSKGELETRLHKLQNTTTKRLVQKLVALPDELFRMIMWDMADHSTLARITLVLQFNSGLVHRLKPESPLVELEFTSAQLHIFDFAFLGLYYQPIIKIANPPTDTAVLRLGVDYLGIRTAEILEQYPATWKQELGNCAWYIIERLYRAHTQFKLVINGPFLRVVSRGYEQVQMWNIINPPEYGSYYSAGRYSTFPRQTRCIDMSTVTGLTVFCDNRSIYGIYAHRANETAISTYQGLYSVYQHTVMWRYFPFEPQEVITKAWIHENSGIVDGTILVIYTSRDRRCFFGACPERERASYQVLCDVSMKHLLYDEPVLGGAITWFGATPKPSLLSQTSPEEDGSDPDFHYTHASLLYVDQAEVYYDDHNASTGVLFRYLDGSSESVGQRRVGLSTTKITQVHHPTRIHLRTFEIKTHDHRMLPCRRTGVEVQFSSENSELLFEKWHSQDMIGTVTWLFTLRKDIVQLSGEP